MAEALLDSAPAPTAVRSDAWLFTSAWKPTAVLSAPSLFEPSAAAPTAVLSFALPFPLLSLFKSASAPTAVFSLAVVFFLSAAEPIAGLFWPGGFSLIAVEPMAVFSEAPSVFLKTGAAKALFRRPA